MKALAAADPGRIRFPTGEALDRVMAGFEPDSRVSKLLWSD